MLKKLKAKYDAHETEIFQTTTYILFMSTAALAIGYAWRGEMLDQIYKAAKASGLEEPLTEYMYKNGPF